MENPGLVNQQHARAGLYPATVCVAGLLIQQSPSHVQRDLRSYREADGSFASSDRPGNLPGCVSFIVTFILRTNVSLLHLQRVPAPKPATAANLLDAHR